MTVALLARPNSPLVLRTGRPFGAADDGGGSEGLAFPKPSTAAGALRAAWHDATGKIDFSPNDAARNAIHVRGPLRCTVRGDHVQLWLPAPADAQLSVGGNESADRLVCLLPTQPGPGSGCDLPYGLQPVLPAAGDLDLRPAPEWWSHDAMDLWLAERPNSESKRKLAKPQICAPLPQATRTHVVIDPDSLQAKDKGLYFSTGVDFTTPAPAESEQGLLMLVDAPPDTERSLQALHHRQGRFGADGTTVTYLEVPTPVGHIPWHCRTDLATALDQVAPDDVIRMVLATPACYLRNGWYPDGLMPSACGKHLQGTPVGLPGWQVRLVAAAVGRFETLAGSAMREANGKRGFTARPMRRLAPAGSVYWLQVLSKATDAPALSRRWLQPSCYEDYGSDGHGLALLGLA